MAQSALNDKAESIIGTYSCKQGDDQFKAKITQQKDGTFTGQIIWVEKDRDANGNKLDIEKDKNKVAHSVVFTK